MSIQLNDTLTIKSNILSNVMDELSPGPSCSKDSYYIKSDCLKHKEEGEKNSVLPLPQLPILNNYSAYEIYDGNNNCMLTNLNDFGLTYFNINADNETVEEYENNNINLESAHNDIDIIFRNLIEGLEIEDNNNKLENNDRLINENINILNLDEIKKHAFDNEQERMVNNHQNLFKKNYSNEESKTLEEYVNIQNYCDESPEWLKFFQDDIEKVLKCNLITKACVIDTVDEIPNDKENNSHNINVIPEIACSVLNEDVEANSAISVESKDCLLVNNGDIVDVNSEYETDESNACSYHSSDFEFIDEEEARKECKLKIRPIDIVKNIVENNAKEFDNDCIINDYFSEPRPVNSCIPSGDDFNNLFLRENVPYAYVNIEHKAISSIKGMEVSPGPNIDLNCLLEEDAKYKQEADESIQIILSTYPKENSRVHPRRSK